MKILRRELSSLDFLTKHSITTVMFAVLGILLCFAWRTSRSLSGMGLFLVRFCLDYTIFYHGLVSDSKKHDSADIAGYMQPAPRSVHLW